MPKLNFYHDSRITTPNLCTEDSGCIYMHCAKCIGEKPADVSPQEWCREEIAFLPDGRMQIWCWRHDCNVDLITPSTDESDDPGQSLGEAIGGCGHA